MNDQQLHLLNYCKAQIKVNQTSIERIQDDQTEIRSSLRDLHQQFEKQSPLSPQQQQQQQQQSSPSPLSLSSKLDLFIGPRFELPSESLTNDFLLVRLCGTLARQFNFVGGYPSFGEMRVDEITGDLQIGVWFFSQNSSIQCFPPPPSSSNINIPPRPAPWWLISQNQEIKFRVDGCMGGFLSNLDFNQSNSSSIVAFFPQDSSPFPLQIHTFSHNFTPSEQTSLHPITHHIRQHLGHQQTHDCLIPQQLTPNTIFLQISDQHEWVHFKWVNIRKKSDSFPLGSPFFTPSTTSSLPSSLFSLEASSTLEPFQAIHSPNHSFMLYFNPHSLSLTMFEAPHGHTWGPPVPFWSTTAKRTDSSVEKFDPLLLLLFLSAEGDLKVIHRVMGNVVAEGFWESPRPPFVQIGMKQRQRGGGQEGGGDLLTVSDFGFILFSSGSNQLSRVPVIPPLRTLPPNTRDDNILLLLHPISGLSSSDATLLSGLFTDCFLFPSQSHSFPQMTQTRWCATGAPVTLIQAPVFSPQQIKKGDLMRFFSSFGKYRKVRMVIVTIPRSGRPELKPFEFLKNTLGGGRDGLLESSTHVLFTGVQEEDPAKVQHIQSGFTKLLHEIHYDTFPRHPLTKDTFSFLSLNLSSSFLSNSPISPRFTHELPHNPHLSLPFSFGDWARRGGGGGGIGVDEAGLHGIEKEFSEKDEAELVPCVIS